MEHDAYREGSKMPMYDLRCKKCGHEYEKLVSYEKLQSVKCPACGEVDNERLYKVNVKGPIAGSASGPSNSGFT